MRNPVAIPKAILVALALAACSAEIGLNSRVDGWSIGEDAACPPEARCPVLVAEAVQVLAERDPFHLPIVEVTVHDEGLYPNDNGGLVPVYRSGGFPTIVLFRLADGSHRAVGGRFMFNDDDPTTFRFGPERQP